MSVTKEQLAQYVAELGLPQEQTDAMVTTLLGNQTAATQFVGQRLRHEDYTKKTQDLSSHKQQLEQAATTQVTAYAQQLSQANTRISDIMKDLEAKDISAATANARLRSVKEKFNLSDEDIPALEVAKPAGSAPAIGTGVDIDAKLKEFKTALVTEMRNELLAMPRVTAIQADIMLDHQELTGKRLTRAEQTELLSEAQKENISLESAWERKYKIADIRMEKRVESEVKTRMDKAEADRRQKASEEAIAGVRKGVDPTYTAQSPVLGKKFVDVPADKTTQSMPVPEVRSSGAERAAAKFLERRANGVPMGTSQPSA